jgi:hypothetical protein
MHNLFASFRVNLWLCLVLCQRAADLKLHVLYMKCSEGIVCQSVSIRQHVLWLCDFWDVMPCSILEVCDVSEERSVYIFRVEDYAKRDQQAERSGGGSMFLRNVGKLDQSRSVTSHKTVFFIVWGIPFWLKLNLIYFYNSNSYKTWDMCTPH